MARLPQLEFTNLEGAFLEMAFLPQSGEVNINNKGVAAANFINITAESDNKIVNISATIPIFFGSCRRGGFIAAAEYMARDYIYFTTNSEKMVMLKPFTSSTLEGAVLSAAFLLEKLESALALQARISGY